MTWLIWRQHRGMLGAFAILFALIGTYYLIDGISLRHTYDAAGLSRCVGVLNDASCAARIEDFVTFDVGLPLYLGPLISLAGGSLGVFLGGPLVAGEIERGTHQWVWTQRISRSRWMASKFLVLASAVAALSFGLATVFAWWDGPLASLTGPFGKEGAFDNSPLILTVYTVFAFSLGVAASTLIRRTVAAMGLAMLLFLSVHIVLSFGLRPYYQTPLTIDSAQTAVGPPTGVDERDYRWRSNFLDANDRVISQQAVNRLADPTLNPAAAGLDYAAVLQRNGIHVVIRDQPFQRAPRFRLIEATLVSTLTLIGAGIAFWRIRRRTP